VTLNSRATWRSGTNSSGASPESPGVRGDIQVLRSTEHNDL
jgi:hypothetical protein